MRRQWLAPVALALALICTCCRSSKDPFDRGQSAEKRGDHADAVEGFSEALKVAPGWSEAQQRLRSSGNEAVAKRFDSLQRLTDPIAAAESCLEIDRLVERAAESEVVLDLPEAYPAVRRERLDGAVASQREKAMQAISRRRWEAARRSLEQARTRYVATTQQQLTLRDDLVLVELARAEHALASGKPCEAFALVEVAQGMPCRPERARELRLFEERLVSANTRTLAVFPVWLSPDKTKIPPGFLDDINYALQAALTSRSLFLQLKESTDVDLWLEQRQLARRMRSVSDCAKAAEDLGVDYVLNAWLERIRLDESSLAQRPVQAKTNGGEDAEYILLTGPMRYVARARCLVVERESGKAVVERVLTVEAKGRMERATYDGNLRELDLNPAERRLFHLGGYRAAENDLMHQVAERLVTLAEGLAGCDR